VFRNTIKFLKEVRQEMRKVTWPSKNEMTSATIVVIVSTLILAFFLGFVDYLLAKGIQPTLARRPTALSFVVFGLLLGLLFWVYRVIEE
jgi:preprotein translocase subunit SecE